MVRDGNGTPNDLSCAQFAPTATMSSDAADAYAHINCDAATNDSILISFQTPGWDPPGVRLAALGNFVRLFVMPCVALRLVAFFFFFFSPLYFPFSWLFALAHPTPGAGLLRVDRAGQQQAAWPDSNPHRVAA